MSMNQDAISSYKARNIAPFNHTNGYISTISPQLITKSLTKQTVPRRKDYSQYGKPNDKLKEMHAGIRMKKNGHLKSKEILIAKDEQCTSDSSDANLPHQTAIITALRVRPMFPSEIHARRVRIIDISNDNKRIRIVNPAAISKDFNWSITDGMIASRSGFAHEIEIDKGYSPYTSSTQESKYSSSNMMGAADAVNRSSQSVIYEDIGKFALQTAWDGYNCSIFAYGQTSAGKTYTMMGNDDWTSRLEPPVYELDDGSTAGLIPRVCSGLFTKVNQAMMGDSCATDKYVEVNLKMSYMEIYNEKVFDLLQEGDIYLEQSSSTNLKSKNFQPLRVRERPSGDIFVENISEHKVSSLHEAMRYIYIGNCKRSITSTNANARSSRSHAILTLHIHRSSRCEETENSIQSKLRLIDLAGSERVNISGATGDQLKETGHINRSLSTLSDVINALSSSKKGHVPYRNSLLTRILKESLGGNAKTIMLGVLSPCCKHYEDSLSTMKYIERARRVIQLPKLNIQTWEVTNQLSSQSIEFKDENCSTDIYAKNGLVPTAICPQVQLKCLCCCQSTHAINSTPEANAQLSYNCPTSASYQVLEGNKNVIEILNDEVMKLNKTLTENEFSMKNREAEWNVHKGLLIISCVLTRFVALRKHTAWSQWKNAITNNRATHSHKYWNKIRSQDNQEGHPDSHIVMPPREGGDEFTIRCMPKDIKHLNGMFTVDDECLANDKNGSLYMLCQTVVRETLFCNSNIRMSCNMSSTNQVGTIDSSVSKLEQPSKSQLKKHIDPQEEDNFLYDNQNITDNGPYSDEPATSSHGETLIVVGNGDTSSISDSLSQHKSVDSDKKNCATIAKALNTLMNSRKLLLKCSTLLRTTQVASILTGTSSSSHSVPDPPIIKEFQSRCTWMEMQLIKEIENWLDDINSGFFNSTLASSRDMRQRYEIWELFCGIVVSFCDELVAKVCMAIEKSVSPQHRGYVPSPDSSHANWNIENVHFESIPQCAMRFCMQLESTTISFVVHLHSCQTNRAIDVEKDMLLSFLKLRGIIERIQYCWKSIEFKNHVKVLSRTICRQKLSVLNETVQRLSEHALDMEESITNMNDVHETEIKKLRNQLSITKSTLLKLKENNGCLRRELTAERHKVSLLENNAKNADDLASAPISYISLNQEKSFMQDNNYYFTAQNALCCYSPEEYYYDTKFDDMNQEDDRNMPPQPNLASSSQAIENSWINTKSIYFNYDYDVRNISDQPEYTEQIISADKITNLCDIAIAEDRSITATMLKKHNAPHIITSSHCLQQTQRSMPTSNIPDYLGLMSRTLFVTPSHSVSMHYQEITDMPLNIPGIHILNLNSSANKSALLHTLQSLFDQFSIGNEEVISSYEKYFDNFIKNEIHVYLPNGNNFKTSIQKYFYLFKRRSIPHQDCEDALNGDCIVNLERFDDIRFLPTVQMEQFKRIIMSYHRLQSSKYQSLCESNPKIAVGDEIKKINSLPYVDESSSNFQGSRYNDISSCKNVLMNRIESIGWISKKLDMVFEGVIQARGTSTSLVQLAEGETKEYLSQEVVWPLFRNSSRANTSSEVLRSNNTASFLSCKQNLFNTIELLSSPVNSNSTRFDEQLYLRVGAVSGYSARQEMLCLCSDSCDIKNNAQFSNHRRRIKSLHTNCSKTVEASASTDEFLDRDDILLDKDSDVINGAFISKKATECITNCCINTSKATQTIATINKNNQMLQHLQTLNNELCRRQLIMQDELDTTKSRLKMCQAELESITEHFIRFRSCCVAASLYKWKSEPMPCTYVEQLKSLDTWFARTIFEEPIMLDGLSLPQAEIYCEKDISIHQYIPQQSSYSPTLPLSTNKNSDIWDNLDLTHSLHCEREDQTDARSPIIEQDINFKLLSKENDELRFTISSLLRLLKSKEELISFLDDKLIYLEKKDQTINMNPRNEM